MTQGKVKRLCAIEYMSAQLDDILRSGAYEHSNTD